MMSDVVCLLFACVAVSHLGLVAAVERVTRHSIPIVGCPKCLSFWTVLAYGLMTGHHPIAWLAISFLCAWSALWLDLLMGASDWLYVRCYETIYDSAANAAPADTEPADADNAMPELRGNKTD